MPVRSGLEARSVSSCARLELARDRVHDVRPRSTPALATPGSGVSAESAAPLGCRTERDQEIAVKTLASVLRSRVLWLVLAAALCAPFAAAAEILLPCSDPHGCPDLLSDAGALEDWVIENQTFTSTDCAVVEGEVNGSGTRKLLRFTFATPNLGAGDVFVGNPANNPQLFDFGSCHGHAHFKEYADYRLWTQTGYNQWNALRAANPNTLPSDLLAANPGLRSHLHEGTKRGFCMIDIGNYGSTQARKYTDCSYQGISVGWGDIYGQYLDGQWIDITGVPEGSYILEVEVNAEQVIEESNYTNNRATTQVAIAPAPGANGLVAAYGFDEGSGPKTDDASGQFNHGTLQGATWTPSGKFGSALVFNGTSSLVSIPNAASLELGNAMTVSAWVYPTAALSGWHQIIKKEVDDYFLSAATPDGGPGGGAAAPTCCATTRTASALPVNTWTHLALTYNGSTLTLYRNGAVVATQSASGSMLKSGLPLRIGGDTVYGEFMQGRIDEVRIYNRALSASEINTIKDTAVNGSGPALPAVSLTDATVAEGDSGSVPASFTASLTPPSTQTVTVQYGTSNDSAAAGFDYSTASGTVTFAPGEVTKPVTVNVLGDTLSEASETYFLTLTNPTNAILGRAQGVGTITDNDPLPALSIADAAPVTEGNSGTTSASFGVSLSPASGRAVSVQFGTASGSATAGSDFSTSTGTLNFAAGDTAKTVTVPVIGDTAVESTENFFVNLSAASAATISRSQATGTITDNDVPGAPTITVTSPNGGTWKIGTSKAIQWTSSGVTGNVKIELSRDDGATWAVLFASAANTGSQSWTVAGPASSAARVRVTSVNAPAATDSSDKKFVIK
jgi:concanavalin A-like lectin/glucanase superfamily protein/lysyl oxidase/Calx-beta domain-containing protein